MTLFETNGVEKSFGGLQALNGVNVSIDEGELVGLIGPNGAGKTTYFNCVTGLLESDDGTVRFNGQDVTNMDSAELAREGMVRTFQLSRTLQTMTVRENVQIAAMDHPGENALTAFRQTDEMYEVEEQITERADDLLNRFDLGHLKDTTAGKISGGDRKILEICRGLMLDPKLFLLDEPFAGVNEATVEEISKYIKNLNDEGMTFVIIEHGLRELVQLVDRLIVLHEGAVLADGDPYEVVSDEQVINVYMGKPMNLDEDTEKEASNA
ncbi:ABC transporter ATP-binding protein [Natrinema gelatinilyticum]|uniref:ABC transporter ATP-binding protein n=1 Tax=Natrinema gelatinilyticum TaxID=2961571 RepID=UPI0020C4F8C1|nr:ABC transporter ATP-binding protein [Natrinema gelatinilyticum]